MEKVKKPPIRVCGLEDAERYMKEIDDEMEEFAKGVKRRNKKRADVFSRENSKPIV